MACWSGSVLRATGHSEARDPLHESRMYAMAFLAVHDALTTVTGKDDCPADLPYLLHGRAYARDFAEVKALGGDGVGTPSSRTADQSEAARFWLESSPRPGRPGSAITAPWSRASAGGA